MSNRILFNIFRAAAVPHLCRGHVLSFLRLTQMVKYTTENKKNLSADEKFETRSQTGAETDGKYKLFHDGDAQIIFDVTDEQDEIDIEAIDVVAQPRNPYEGLNMQRGANGVFDIEDLIIVLKKDNAKDIFVALVPKEAAYVDYIVVVTAKSQKHMSALATFVRKVYKMKRNATDILPRVEGEDSRDWVAMDLGNIVLHIFSRDARTHYDLETLWTVGTQYDDKSNQRETEIDLAHRYNAFLTNFQPADT